MTRFVEMVTAGNTWRRINPDQVAYMTPAGDVTELIFGAVNGGLHTVIVKGTADEVQQQLEGGPTHGAQAPRAITPLPSNRAQRRGKAKAPK